MPTAVLSPALEGQIRAQGALGAPEKAVLGGPLIDTGQVNFRDRQYMYLVGGALWLIQPLPEPFGHNLSAIKQV